MAKLGYYRSIIGSIFVCAIACQVVLCEKILIIHPIYSGSHVLTLSTVAEAMTQRGHQVRVVRWKDNHGAYPAKSPNISSTTLAMDNSQGFYPFLTQEKQATFEVPFDILWNSGMQVTLILDLYRGYGLLEGQCEALLSNYELIKELQEEQYNVAIVDVVYNECALVLLHHLGIPAVGYWAFPFSSGEADVTTAFLPPSHVPAGLSGYSDRMSFFQRFCNTLGYLAYRAVLWMQCNNIHHVAKKYYPDSPHPMDLLKNMSGMLINTDYSLDYPRLLPPTFANVGGMQIRKPRPLPEEVQDWIDDSGEHGVILFTMGFIFNPKIMPRSLINAFMKAFSLLPQKVLMRFDGDIDYIPPNVKALTWIPQQDVLANPKTKVFLTHCGLHGVMEAIYYGVPMVGMPIFLDQGDVLRKMENKGVALGFRKDNATWEEIYRALKEVLYNKKYTENAEKLSRIMRDAKETPLDRAAELLEYIMRHEGAEHLKLSSRYLNFFQYFCLDVAAVLLCLLATGIFGSLWVVSFILKNTKLFYKTRANLFSSCPFKILDNAEINSKSQCARDFERKLK